MMKKRILRTLVIVVAALLLVSALPLFGFAGTTPSVSIDYCNLTFENETYIKYAVKFDGVADSSISRDNTGMLYWTAPQSEYTVANAEHISDIIGYTTDIPGANGQKYYTFSYDKFTAKQMVDYVYSVAYILVDGVYYYSDVAKYSILSYAYDNLGYTGTASSNDKFKAKLTDLLNYGASAQKNFEYKTDRLANDKYYEAIVQNGTLDDGFSFGLYLTGESFSAKSSDGSKTSQILVENFNVIVDALTGNVSVGAHTCVPGEPVRENEVDPTCLVGGSYDAVVYCTVCDEELTRQHTPISPLAHTWEDVAEKAHTCFDGGNKAYSKCSACGSYTLDKNADPVVFVSEEETKVAAAHSYDFSGAPMAESKPTCMAYGFKIYGCNVCGAPADTTGTEVELPEDQEGWVAFGVWRVPKLPHNMAINPDHAGTVAGDCTNDRIEYHECINPGCLYEESVVANKAPGHSWDTVEFKAYCQLGGYKIDSCTACGQVRIETEAPALSGRPVTDAEGKYDKTEVDPNSHIWNPEARIVSTAPTCIKKGQAIDFCTYCSAFTTVSLPFVDHNTDKLIKEVEPVCGSDGYYVFGCSTCNGNRINIKASSLDPSDPLYSVDRHNKLEHVYDGDPHHVAPTCTKAGYDEYYCQNGCGTVKREYYFNSNDEPRYPATGHKYELVIQYPSCVLGSTESAGVAGSINDVCINCGEAVLRETINFDFNNPFHHEGAYQVAVIQEGNSERAEITEWYCPKCDKRFYVTDDSMVGTRVSD